MGDGYPDWRIHLRFRVQHRRILPREGDVFADVRCARKPEDHLDHRDCRAAWDKEISPMSVVGFGIFFLGLFAYSYLTFRSRQQAQKPAATEPVKETTKLVS